MAAKKRSENFSPDEILFIIELVEKHIDIIQSKQTNQVTNAKKTDCWRKITESVNARGGVCRTIEQVKEKYRKACSKAKGRSVSQRVHQKKTGGGPPKAPLDAVSRKILDLHEDSPNFTGFVGGVEVGGLIITGKQCYSYCMYSFLNELI